MYIYINIHFIPILSADGITLLHFGVVEHSLCGVDWVTVSKYCKAHFPRGSLSTLAP